MKKYSRTRPQPSSESVSRSKKEFRQVQAIAHPFFSDENLLLGDEINDDSKKLFDQSDRQEQLMLEGIHGWRPNAVILLTKRIIHLNHLIPFKDYLRNQQERTTSTQRFYGKRSYEVKTTRARTLFEQ
jgi:hypothetical protein